MTHRPNARATSAPRRVKYEVDLPDPVGIGFEQPEEPLRPPRARTCCFQRFDDRFHQHLHRGADLAVRIIHVLGRDVHAAQRVLGRDAGCLRRALDCPLQQRCGRASALSPPRDVPAVQHSRTGVRNELAHCLLESLRIVVHARRRCPCLQLRHQRGVVLRLRPQPGGEIGDALRREKRFQAFPILCARLRRFAGSRRARRRGRSGRSAELPAPMKCRRDGVLAEVGH